MSHREEEGSTSEPKADRREVSRLTNEGARLLQLRRPGEALKVLEEAWSQAPDDADVATNLGGAYVMQRRWRKAVRFLEEATQRWPDHALLWMNLAAAYLGPLESAGTEAQQRAIEAFEKALRCDPMVPNANYNLGLIYKERGEFERAAAHFWRALEVDPHDRDAQFWLRQLPMGNRRRDEGRG
jgi:tetratricopeptide (TPR) repeat protein